MAAIVPAESAARLTPVAFDDLRGFADDDLLDAFQIFRRSAEALTSELAPTRVAVAASPALRAAARAALREPAGDDAAARGFFRRWFQPRRIDPPRSPDAGLLTGYYEPRLAGSLTATPDFTGAVLARPPDLMTLAQGEAPDGLAGAQILPGGRRRPYPTRAEIEATTDRHRPILWLRDAVEVFLAQVQGSACVDLTDGRSVRLAYDGRNGRPYTSIGRLLIEAGAIAERDMSLARLKQWLRDNDVRPRGRARMLMQRNESYVFFKLVADFESSDGPTGGAGIGLSPLRSIAIDRALWSYGLPFWIDAHLPWRGDAPSAFARLMIAQDTGSAIVGPARADIYFGQGDEAGARAGAIRHAGQFTVLLPNPERA
jgi:membrane-bound lytic murein transglycosylase A